MSDRQEPEKGQDAILIDPRTIEEKTQTLHQSVGLITKSYLADLHKYNLIPFVGEANVEEYSRFFELKDIVYAKEEDFLQKAVTILYTAYALDATVVVLMSSNGNSNRYLLGISVPENQYNLGDTFSSFHKAVRGNFSINSQIKEDEDVIENDKLRCQIREVFGEDSQVVTSISGIPALRKADKHTIGNFIQGIENLTDAMRGSAYSLLIQATPVDNDELRMLKASYEGIYTNLSPYAKSDCNYNISHVAGTNEAIADTKSTQRSTTKTTSQSDTKGHTITDTDGESYSKTINKGAMAAGVLAAGAALAVAAAPAVAAAGVGGIVGTAAGAITTTTAAIAEGSVAAASIAAGATAGVGGIGAVLSGLIGSETNGTNHSTAVSNMENVTVSESDAETTGEQDAHTVTQGSSASVSSGHSIQYTIEDKTVQNIQALVEENLKRIQLCENYGTFQSCAYVLSNDVATNQCVAAIYEALMRGDTSFTQGAQIHTWKKKQGSEGIKAYLSHLYHPCFSYPIGDRDAVVTPALIMSGEELALQIGLPKKSVPGIMVRQCAEFGCNPPQPETKDSLELGKVYRMGRSVEAPVKLSKKSLTSHTFITGSTGVGKSNTIYHILDNLRNDPESNVKFMVVEPAKGEYKEVFGGLQGVKVYGTNAKKSELLHLNPFAFNHHKIHILEHIDRLVEIFNACWPMYAAMPAVLKDAVEQAYIKRGWNLVESTSSSGTYPTFHDVLVELPLVMEKSAYSADTKGDYTGALVTRVKSLTNGIYGQVFCALEETTAEDLFEKNIIVDLSRVGASETKALIMGLLVMKLQEYRMGQDTRNSDLIHVTVLEEAHNLLRRTSSEQSQEGSNLQGKSVEMLANAIAEMRTYGEGFIIADQSPGLLDPSAIRNTNTKILMRLPDQTDRELVGRAVALNDEQIVDLAKLGLGVAAVYQNDWLEAVLCKVNKHGKEYPYDEKSSSTQQQLAAIVQCLIAPNEAPTLNQEDVDNLICRVKRFNINDEARGTIQQCLSHKEVPLLERNNALYDLVGGKWLVSELICTDAQSPAQNVRDVSQKIAEQFSGLSSEESFRVVAVLLDVTNQTIDNELVKQKIESTKEYLEGRLS